MYFGQQNIVANSDAGTNAPITDQGTMNNITYTVNADPVAVGGTWRGNNTNETSAYNQFGGQHMDSILGPTTNGYNYPINVYPAGSYGYSVTQQDQDVQSKADPVTVNYPAGLGTSVSANFNNGDTASLSVQISNGGNGDTLGFGTGNANNPLLNGSGNNADTNVIFNNAVKSTGTNGQNSIANNSTITLTENSTRPQSV